MEDGLLYAEAGVACPKVARFAADHNLGSAELLTGIPGTVGGALAMNAGCYGGETWDIVERVVTINRRGQLRRRGKDEFEFGYRHCELKTDASSDGDEWFASAHFRLPEGDRDESRAIMKALLTKRRATQPLQLPNAGSVFRNPAEGKTAARLIQSCGLKSYRDRRRAHLGEARQLHRQSGRRGQRRRHRGADPARAGRWSRKRPASAWSPKCASSGSRAMNAPRFRQSRRAAGRQVGRARDLAHERQRRAARRCARKGVDAHAFDPAERDLFELKREGFARCFIALHGRGGEDGTRAGRAGSARHSLHRQRRARLGARHGQGRTKLVWQASGLPTPRYELLDAGERHARASPRRLGLPLIVKPANEGSSIGMTKVRAAGELEEAYALAANYDRAVIAEQFIDGPEYTASIVGDAALPLIRIEAPQGNYDYQNKYFTDDTKYICPCGLPAPKEDALKALALKAFQVARLPRLGPRRPDARRARASPGCSK